VQTNSDLPKKPMQPNDSVLYRRALEIGKETLKAEGMSTQQTVAQLISILQKKN
jgi:hypothetical protein